MRRARTRTVAGGTALLALAALAGCSGNDARGTQLAPDFSLQDLDGRTHRLSDYRGRVVLLDFWATWCGPCRKEVPHFVRIQEKHRDRGLTVLGISLDRQGAAVVRPFMEEHKVNYVNLLADASVTQSFGGIRSIPTTFVIDRQGRIVRKLVGYHPEAVFDEIVAEALAAPAGGDVQ